MDIIHQQPALSQKLKLLHYFATFTSNNKYGNVKGISGQLQKRKRNFCEQQKILQ